jgi:DNA-binding IclR family transcriptional regulator
MPYGDAAPDASRSAYRERNSTSDRTLEILGLFGPDRLSITASELAGEFGVARSTVYRYLQTLTQNGYLEEDPHGGFRLGLRVFELARLARQSYGLSEVVRPVLSELAQTSGETALLTRRSGSQIVCLEREETRAHHVRLSYERGSVLSLNAGASAFVLLAWEDPDVVSDLLASVPLPKYTQATLTSPREIIEHFAVVRKQGYAVTRGELDPDVIGIAAPIRDGDGAVVAGLSVVAVERRVPTARVRELIDQVRKSADVVSDTLALVAN